MEKRKRLYWLDQVLLLNAEEKYKDKISECNNFWSWLCHDWCYITRSRTKRFERVFGRRRFGFVTEKFYEMPPGKVF